MPYCQNCGAEVDGNFCQICGQKNAASNSDSSATLYENATVKARYGVGSMLLAGYWGMAFLAPGLSLPGDFAIKLTFFCLGILCFLPGIFTIRRNTPKEAVVRTAISFVFKSFLFVVAWIIVVLSCMLIIGFLVRSWRLGVLVSRCNDDEYTAFMGDRMIEVVRVPDPYYSSDTKTRYWYIDKEGNYYRPPLHG